jgi:hypothetical protein
VTFGWRTVTALEGDIVYRYATAGLQNRHPTGVNGRIRQLFNASWRETREIIAMALDGGYFVRGSTLALPVAPPVTGEVYVSVPFPTDAVSVVLVLVQSAAGRRWIPLDPTTLPGLYDTQRSTLTSFGGRRMPRKYVLQSIPDGVGSTETAGQILLAPIPTAGNYAVWYVQAWADRTANNDTIPGMANHIEHAILGTLIKMAQPDSDSQKQVQIWMMERARIENLVEERAKRILDGMAMEPRDARYDGEDEDWSDEF